jgi:hypothetical protein
VLGVLDQASAVALLNAVKSVVCKIEIARSLLHMDVLLARPSPILPPGPFRRRVFDAMYELSHPGVKAMHTLVGACYVWHGLRRDVAQ